MTENCKKIIDFLNCEYILFENEKDPRNIQQTYMELLEQGKKEAFTPLIISVSDILTEMIDFLDDEAFNLENMIREAEEINPSEYFKQEQEEYSDDEENPCIDDLFGEFELQESSNSFVSYGNSYGELSDEILIVKIPTNKPWELPIYVPMGGFNDCPDPVHQAAVFKYWYEKYHAYPACVTYDVWEMYCENPVKDRETAFELAKEMYFFCSDIVDQGVETIGRLAGCLVNSSVWFFWWD